jgi:hypothetical protein
MDNERSLNILGLEYTDMGQSFADMVESMVQLGIIQEKRQR